MSQGGFNVTGLEGFGKVADLLRDDIQKAVTLASKTGVNKAADKIAYGYTSAISPSKISSTSVIGRAASTLRVSKEHLYYRTFVQGVKVSAGKGRSARPYASIMIRGNAINVVDLLVKGQEAKAMYGFKTRKKRTSGKVRPNMSSKVGRARVGGRRSGVINIAGTAYNNAYLENGSYRASSKAMNEHYMNNLGAKAMKLDGKRFMLFQRKSSGQSNPYPVKAVKISKLKVRNALIGAATASTANVGSVIKEMQLKEVQSRLKKLGLIK